MGVDSSLTRTSRRSLRPKPLGKDPEATVEAIGEGVPGRIAGDLRVEESMVLLCLKTLKVCIPGVMFDGVPNLEVRGAQNIHSLRDQTPPLCDPWYLMNPNDWFFVFGSYFLT